MRLKTRRLSRGRGMRSPSRHSRFRATVVVVVEVVVGRDGFVKIEFMSALTFFLAKDTLSAPYVRPVLIPSPTDMDAQHTSYVTRRVYLSCTLKTNE